MTAHVVKDISGGIVATGFGEQDPWPGKAPVWEEADVYAEYETDVVVVGGGQAGLNCALAAVEGGASVVVVEKKPSDKMFWMGEQIGTFNSQYLTSLGFGGYDLEEVIDEFCRANVYYINRALVSLYVKNSGEALDHLLSFIPKDSSILYSDQCNIQQGYNIKKYPIVRGGYKTWAATLQFRGDLVTSRDVRYRTNQNSRMSELCGYAMAESVRLGADWRFGHSALVLTKENGRVTGVIVKNTEGRLVRFKARTGIVIATGEMSDSGYRLGIWAGGHLDNTPMELQRRGSGPPNMGEGMTVFGTPSFLRLNAQGMRYCNECVPYGNADAIQPSGITSTVTDSKWLSELRLQGLQHGNPDFGMPAFIEQCREDMSHVVDAGKEGYMVRNCALSEREKGRIYGAETLEELADILGYVGEDKNNWLKSITRYNKMCYNGYDSDFHKDADILFPVDEPPYYAWRRIIEKGSKWEPNNKPLNMCNGLHTDNEFRVVDEDGIAIKGLYTAGRTVGYLHSVFYATPCGGNYIGMAITHGRILGKKLAEKLKGGIK